MIKNKITLIIIGGVLLFSIFFIIIDKDRTVNDINLPCYNTTDTINMIVKEGSPTNRSVTLIINNNTNYDYLYGEGYYVEHQENGSWVKVEGMPEYFILIGYTLRANQTIQIIRTWGWQKELSAGEYRINKTFTRIISENVFGNEYHLSAVFIVQ